MAVQREGLEIQVRAVDAQFVAYARCGACGLVAESAMAQDAIVGMLREDPARDPQARATLTRRVLGSLRAQGCSHAVHDRAAMADCALRPDRARLPTVLGALFDASEELMRDLLRVSALHTSWKDARLDLRWRRGLAPFVEQELDCGAGRDAALSVEMAADEAWEMLSSRGLVPVEWLGHDGRGFRSHIEQGIARAPTPEYRVRPWRTATVPERTARGHDELRAAPATLRECVAIASDCAGASAAETLVHEVLARLAPWGVGRATRVTWRVVDAARWRTERQSYWGEPLRAALAEALESGGYKLPLGYGPTDPPMQPSWWSLAAAESELARLWESLRADRVLVPKATREGGAWDFAALPNPYEPLLAIWSTGFVFDELREDEAILVAAHW